MADDVTWTNIGSTKYSGTFVGKEALIANLLGPLFDQLSTGIATTLHGMIAEIRSRRGSVARQGGDEGRSPLQQHVLPCVQDQRR